mmetsp:Transcript_28378/g.25099  ORF Transcript_28378/g.25099 Transcript_28378/m.25099 type:complete len:120 (+) Transcript_28378:86-445(+)
MHSNMQTELIKELQREVTALKYKLSNYEENCKCSTKKADASTETEPLMLQPAVESERYNANPGLFSIPNTNVKPSLDKNNLKIDQDLKDNYYTSLNYSKSAKDEENDRFLIEKDFKVPT